MRILLVDDEPSVLFALKLLLQALGYSVTDFTSAAEAIFYLEKGEPCDVFICDLRMSPKNGIEALKDSKKVRPELPFILMSGHARDEEILEARALGAIGFLAKPFRPEEVKELLGSSIQN